MTNLEKLGRFVLKFDLDQIERKSESQVNASMEIKSPAKRSQWSTQVENVRLHMHCTRPIS